VSSVIKPNVYDDYLYCVYENVPENFLALQHGSLQRQITKALTAAISVHEECQWLSAALVTTVIGHYLANCVYSCLC